jgi:hypothetical protein
LGIGTFAKMIGRTAAKHFRVRAQLDMNFKTDNSLPFHKLKNIQAPL